MFFNLFVQRSMTVLIMRMTSTMIISQKMNYLQVYTRTLTNFTQITALIDDETIYKVRYIANNHVIAQYL